jgi:hypothetical protein
MLATTPFAAEAAACPLRTSPESLNEAWQAAVDSARAELEAHPGDCAEVRLRIDPGGSTLTYTARDGRKAVRILGDATELSPTLEALALLPEPTPPKSPPGGPPSPERPSSAPTSREAGAHGVLSALLGGRLAGPSLLVAPVVDLGAALALGRWELGLRSAWSPTYRSLDRDDGTRPARLASVGVGIEAGRRTPLSKALTLLTGVGLSAAAEHEGWHVRDANGARVEQETDRAQALVGVYAGVLLPAQSSTRFRAVLACDVDATHLGNAAVTTSGVPALPWWGLTLAFGVESEVL